MNESTHDISVTLYSDFICPFCYIAERGPIARLLQEHELTLHWQGFQLHPQIPPGGVALRKVVPTGDAGGMRAGLQSMADDYDLPIRFPKHLPNTVPVLSLAEVARDEGDLNAYRSAALDAYWVDGADLEDDSVLTSLAAAAGLDESAMEKSRSPEYKKRLMRVREEGFDRGVMGVPVAFFERGEQSVPVMGCQPYERYEKAIRLVLES